MTERMTDERIKFIEHSPYMTETKSAAELFAALKAERQRVEELERHNQDYIDSAADCLSQRIHLKNRAEAAEAKVETGKRAYTDMFVNSLLEIRAAEAKVAELEASATGGYEDGWHALRGERDELKAKVVKVSAKLHDLLTLDIPELQLSLKEADDKLEAVRGLVGRWRSSNAGPCYDAVDTGMNIAGMNCADELEALLK